MESEYIMGYHSLFTGLGKSFGDELLDLSREEWPDGFCLYAFDMTADQASDDNYFSLIKTGSIRCEMTFGTDLPHTVNLIIHATFENLLQIDLSRNIRYDFAT